MNDATKYRPIQPGSPTWSMKQSHPPTRAAAGRVRSWLPVRVPLAGYQPKIAIHDRVAVVLQLDRQWQRRLLLAAARFRRDFAVPVNGHAVVQHGDSRVGGLRLAVRGKSRRCEPNVIRLPGQR